MIPVGRLRWKVGSQDVTCANCHSAIYQPGKGETMCPTCRAALFEDVVQVHNSLATKARAVA